MRHLTYSLILLFVPGLALTLVQASDTLPPSFLDHSEFAARDIDKGFADFRVPATLSPHRLPACSDRAIFVRWLAAGQKSITTVWLATDQIFTIKTAQGIATRIVFPDKVTEIICGDLYDPLNGNGTFVVQKGGRDVYVKPIAARRTSNLFVTTGEGAARRIYGFDLDVVSSPAMAHRVVNVMAAPPPQKAPGQPAPSQPAQPATARPGPATATLLATTEPSAKSHVKPARFFSLNPPETGNIRVSDVAAVGAGGILFGALSATSVTEPIPPAPEPTKKGGSRLDPAKKQDPKPEQPKTIRKSGGVLVGEAIKKFEPAYPLRAKAARISGAVVVEVTVDEKGDVVAAHAISGNPLLADAAVNAAREWRFKPTKLGGQPVRVIGTITFNFVL